MHVYSDRDNYNSEQWQFSSVVNIVIIIY